MDGRLSTRRAWQWTQSMVQTRILPPPALGSSQANSRADNGIWQQIKDADSVTETIQSPNTKQCRETHRRSSAPRASKRTLNKTAGRLVLTNCRVRYSSATAKENDVERKPGTRYFLPASQIMIKSPNSNNDVTQQSMTQTQNACVPTMSS